MTLAPCPMPGCTGEARYVKRQAGMPGTMGHDQWHAIACAKCGITLGESDRRFRNRDEAARAWNDLAKAQPAPVGDITNALADAATSLETIAHLAGRKTYGTPPLETLMGTHGEVRAYAASRAGVARAALAAQGGQ